MAKIILMGSVAVTGIAFSFQRLIVSAPRQRWTLLLQLRLALNSKAPFKPKSSIQGVLDLFARTQHRNRIAHIYRLKEIGELLKIVYLIPANSDCAATQIHVEQSSSLRILLFCVKK